MSEGIVTRDLIPRCLGSKAAVCEGQHAFSSQMVCKQVAITTGVIYPGYSAMINILKHS